MSERGIRRFVRDELVRLATTDWSQLAAVPSTSTWRAVAYLRGLPDARRAHLFSVLESMALTFFGPPDLARSALWQDEEYKRLVTALVGAQEWNWAYASVRTLRSVLGGYKSKSPKMAAEFAGTPLEVIARAEQIAPVRANELRKLVKAAIGLRYGARPDNSGGGDWLYRGTSSRGLDFVLSIDYGGYDQLRYEVSYEEPHSGVHAQRLNYERLVGCGGAGWDFVTADNAEASVDLMCSFVDALLTIPERASSVGGPTER